jgi:hypothetical protein
MDAKKGSLFAATAALLIVGCGTSVFDHTVRVLCVNPPAHCGSSLRVLAFTPTQDYSADAQWAGGRTSLTAPNAPYVATVSATDVKWMWDFSPSQSVSIGLFIPCVRSDGWWVIDVVPQRGVAVAGSARFCPWGTLTPASDAPVLPISTLGVVTKGRAWDLTIRVRMPSAATT